MVGGSPEGVSPELLWELSEGMSLVVAVDSGGNWCSAAGVIPDLLVGDMDSIDPAVLQQFAEQEVEQVVYPVEKDKTDIELAVGLVIERGYSDLVATNVLGGRIDHEMATLGILMTAGISDLAITVVEDDQTLVFLNNPGIRQQLRLSFADNMTPENAPLMSLIPWGRPATVSLSGFQWDLDHAELDPAKSLGVSNYPIDIEPLIELHDGALIVVVLTPGV